MTVYRFLPSPPLSAYVEAFCFSEGEAALHTKERRLPDGRVALVINLEHETLRVSHPEDADQFQSFHGGVLSGAHSQFSVLDTTTLVTTIHVCFKPGGARPFLPMPAAELTNQVACKLKVTRKNVPHIRYGQPPKASKPKPRKTSGTQ